MSKNYKVIMITSILVVGMLSGCAPQGGLYGVDQRTSNGAITGAAVGAGVSAITGGDSTDILQGAAVGAAVGAIGATLTEPQ